MAWFDARRPVGVGTDRSRRRQRPDGRRFRPRASAHLGKGLFLGIEFVRDPATAEPFPDDTPIGTLIGHRALDNGLLTRFDPTWIALGPPLIISESEVDQMIAILDRSIAQVLETL